MRFAPELTLAVAIVVGAMLMIATEQAAKAIPKHLLGWVLWTLPGVIIGVAVMVLVGGIDTVPAAILVICFTALGILARATARSEKARLAELAKDRWKGRWGPPE